MMQHGCGHVKTAVSCAVVDIADLYWTQKRIFLKVSKNNPNIHPL